MISANTLSIRRTHESNLRLALMFLEGIHVDNNGRTYYSYLRFTEEQMENDHQWIQWAFPIETPSPHNPYAPLIPHAICPEHGYSFNLSRWSKIHYRNKMLHKYLISIGINPDMKDTHFCVSGKFFDVVDSQDNHHVKRITRIIRHLRLTGDIAMADRLLKIFKCAAEMCEMFYPRDKCFTAQTLQHWESVPEILVAPSPRPLLTDQQQKYYTG